MCKNNNSNQYSQSVLCQQLHGLYEILEERKNQILADPEFNPANEELNNELEEIYVKMKLIQECFEKFCPS